MDAAVEQASRGDWAAWNWPRAVGLSLAIHLAFFGGVELRRTILEHGLLPSWVKTLLAEVPEEPQAEKRVKPKDTVEIPLVFVEVDPAQATAEAPKSTTYYSSMNSLAANPQPSADATQPRLEGTQERIAKTYDVPRPQAPVPAPPPEPAATPPPEVAQAPPPEPAPVVAPQEEQPRPETKEPEPIGDLAMLQPEVKPKFATGAPPRPRASEQARRTRVAKLQPQPGLTGEKMRQAGGVRRIGSESLDVKRTEFGAYDYALVMAVQQRWESLLMQWNYAGDGRGKVVITFQLKSDGAVTDLQLVETEVGYLLAFYCQKAIQDPSPFEAWPSDMYRLVGKSYRDMRFTFYY